jgi:hypothetical protein
MTKRFSTVGNPWGIMSVWVDDDGYFHYFHTDNPNSESGGGPYVGDAASLAQAITDAIAEYHASKG